MKDLVIRDLDRGDTDTVVEIALAAWEPIFESYRTIMGERLFRLLCPDWRARKAGQVRAGCDPAGLTRACAAEFEGRVVGFVTFRCDNDTKVGEIGNNAVHPEFQGRGIAGRMYEHVFDRLRALGMEFVKVNTGGDPGHAPARRAYEKAGFSTTVPEVTYYRRL